MTEPTNEMNETVADLRRIIAGMEANMPASLPYIKGDHIEKRGGDYDADARFVCTFDWEGVTRIVGAIPQKRGWLFYIFNPKQISFASESEPAP